MGKVLTVKSVEAMKPDPTKRREIPDGGLVGLYHVLQPTGGRSWAVRYRVPGTGKPAKVTLGPYPLLGLAEARSAAREALQAVARGEDPGAAKKALRKAPEADDRDLVRTVAADFMKRHASKNRSADETQRILDREVLPRWGDRKIGDVTRRDVLEMLDAIVDRGAPTMANRTLAAVRKLFNWAVSRDILAAAPTAGVKPPGDEKSRERVLSDDELRWFWQATGKIGEPFGPMFRLLVLTAQRRDEVGGMRTREIAGDLWTIPAERAKNGREHAIKLSAPALEALGSAKRVAGRAGYVFTTTGDTPASGFSRAKDRLDAAMLEIAKAEAAARGDDPERVEIPHWTLHDLRRTAASGMARIGINLPVIERVLNHVSGSFGGVAGVYNRYSFADEMARALDAWASFVMATVEPGAAENVVALRGRA